MLSRKVNSGFLTSEEWQETTKKSKSKGGDGNASEGSESYSAIINMASNDEVEQKLKCCRRITETLGVGE